MTLFRQVRQPGEAGGLGRGLAGRRDARPLGVPMLPVWTPFWSIGFHRELLRLVDAELTATGLRHRFEPAGAVSVHVDDQATRLDLRALAHLTATRPLREWPELVRDAVGGHVAAAQAAARFCACPPSVGDAGPLLALVLSDDTTPSTGRRPLADGLAVELTYDLPAGTTPVPEHHLASWGAKADDLWEAAAENTRIRVRAVLSAGREVHGGYDVVAHPSPFTASTVLCMAELAGPVVPYGVLFGVPSRFELVAHVITAPEPAARALRDLPSGICRRHARVAGPMSARLYWWRAGQVVVVPPGTDAAELIGGPARAWSTTSR